ncbi:MAG: tetratricopeptide repeat protein [Bacteroidia bacterium]|nr:tetratricopeptide repeat protein [Bacteroidia bacterium]
MKYILGLLSLFCLNALSSPLLLAQEVPQLLSTADQRYKQGNYTASIEACNQALELESAHYEAYQKRARGRRMLGQLENALQDYNTALRLNPSYAPAYLGRAQTKIRLQDYAGAIQDYNLALQINPSTAYQKAILYNRALAKQKTGDLAGALKDYDYLLEYFPDYTKALVNRGLIKYQQNGPREACPDWIKAMKLGSVIATQNAERACDCCL